MTTPINEIKGAPVAQNGSLYRRIRSAQLEVPQPVSLSSAKSIITQITREYRLCEGSEDQDRSLLFQIAAICVQALLGSRTPLEEQLVIPDAEVSCYQVAMHGCVCVYGSILDEKSLDYFLESVKMDLEGLEEDVEYTISRKRWTPAELDALPDFDGF